MGYALAASCRMEYDYKQTKPHLQETMKVYLRERKYAAKSSGKPESLPYFQSWLPSDNL